MRIEIVYATPQKQMLLVLWVTDGVTAQEAIMQSNILNHFPNIDFTLNKIGVFGKIVPLSHILSDGDRVEIYRPLVVDPKQIRKIRAQKL